MNLTPLLLKEYFLKLQDKGVEFVHFDQAITTLENTNFLTLYCGYEISGKPHIGTWLTFLILEYLSSFDNTKVYCLLADLHTSLNKKELKYKDMSESFLPLFPNTKINFITGSSGEFGGISGFQKSTKYINLFYEFITNDVSLNRVLKSTELNLRDENINLPFSKLIYPILQAIDITFLDVDVSIGGMDQRKIHMLHSDKTTAKTVTYLHLPILTLNDKKISKSEIKLYSIKGLLSIFPADYKTYVLDLFAIVYPLEDINQIINRINEIDEIK